MGVVAARSLSIAAVWAGLVAGCVQGEINPGGPGPAAKADASSGAGGAAGPLGSGGSGSGGNGTVTGSGGSGGAEASGGSGGETPGGTGGGGVSDGGAVGGNTGADVSPADTARPEVAPPVIDYEGQIPMWTGGPVGPEVTMECAGDPTTGWTEYQDTFKVQHPHDLKALDRFKLDKGIFTFWVFPGDKAHTPDSDTEPRTEARWSNFANTQQHLWSADMMLESPSNHVTIMQVHTTASGAGPVYLRVDNGNLHRLNGSNFASGLYDKWFNLKVAFNPGTLQSTVYINNCPKSTGTGPRGDGNNYFKNGVYTCTSSICRAHYKNIHLYRRP